MQSATCAFPYWGDNASDANNNSNDNNPYSLMIKYNQDGALRQRILRLTMQESDNEDVLKVNHVFPQTISVVAASIETGPYGVACLFMYRPIATPEESSGNVGEADVYTETEYEGEDGEDGSDRSGNVGRLKQNAPTRAEILPFDYVSRWATQDFNEVYCTAPAYQDLLQ